MARTVEEIQEAQLASIQQYLPQLTSPSVTAIYRLISYVIAVSLSVFEQILDNSKAQMQTIADETPSGTDIWWVARAKEFQYDATNPQTVVLKMNQSVGYAVVDEDLQIITSASLVTNEAKRITLKVAKGDIENLQPLSTLEYNAMVSYVDKIAYAGLVPDLISVNADRLLLNTTIYYNGEYIEADVLADCISSVETYLQTLDFNGRVYIQEVTDALQSVVGVSDVVVHDMTLRSDTQTISEGTNLVESDTTIVRNAISFAGYIKQEDTGGSTFTDTFTLITDNE